MHSVYKQSTFTASYPKWNPDNTNIYENQFVTFLSRDFRSLFFAQNSLRFCELFRFAKIFDYLVRSLRVRIVNIDDTSTTPNTTRCPRFLQPRRHCVSVINDYFSMCTSSQRLRGHAISDQYHYQRMPRHMFLASLRKNKKNRNCFCLWTFSAQKKWSKISWHYPFKVLKCHVLTLCKVNVMLTPEAALSINPTATLVALVQYCSILHWAHIPLLLW